MDLDGAIPLIRGQGLVLVMDTPKGRGVFASADIPAYTVLEVSPVLVLDPMENELYIRNTELCHYTYNWPIDAPSNSRNKNATNGNIKSPTTTQAVILGLGSLFNHSIYKQNVGWIRDVPNKLIRYTTLRDVRRGEELCISYGDRLTFVDADARFVNVSAEDDEGMLANIQVV